MFLTITTALIKFGARIMSWKNFHKETENNPPNRLLQAALNYVKEGRALDLGAGNLNDAKYLVKQGFNVVALDKYLESGRVGKMRIMSAPFQDFPVEKYNLISAMWSLPFHGEEGFDELIQSLKESLSKDGIFAAHFFGVKDERRQAVIVSPERINAGAMKFHSKNEVKALFMDMEILYFGELEYEYQLVGGGDNHCHIFEVIAKKRDFKNS